MGLVEYKGLLMEEDVVEQLKLRHEQDDSGRWDNEAAERKQAAEIKQTVERKQTNEFMQNDVSKDSDISGIGCNSGEAANKEEMDFVSKHNKEAVCDRDDKEDDCMREYKVNGVLILACDNGYGNTKGAHVVFRTSVDVSDTPPAFSKDYLEHKGKYYILSEGHKSFVADKVMDDDTYILTLATIAKELKIRGLHEAKIHLAVGLPLKWC